MSDSDLREFKAALSALESFQPVSGSKPFRLLRRTLTLAMKCAASHTDDPEVWRTLGEIELMRHEKYRRRSQSGQPQAKQWLPRVAASFDRASDYLGRAFLAGDESAKTYLSYLYAERAGSAKPGASKPLDAFAEESFAFHAMCDIFMKDGQEAMMLAVLRRAGRRGHVWALADLAAHLHGSGDMRDQKEAVALLQDAGILCLANKSVEPGLKAKVKFLTGVCEYLGLGGLPPDRDGGLMLVVEAMNDGYPEAETWLNLHVREFLKTKPRLPAQPPGSPLRFFSPSYPRLARAGRDAEAALFSPQSEARPEIVKSEEDILAPLDGLVGLPAIKEDVARLVNLGRLQDLRILNGLKPIPLSLHMAFLGDPGTGKTMTARLIGQVLKDAGLLKKGHLVETDRSGLVGEYIGQTEKLTRAKLEEAVGGVLFIDEAYALGVSDSARDYGRHAIEVILKFMEDRRDDLLIIIAGYPGPMKTFFAANPGIRSRFTHTFEFPPTGPAEAGQLFRLFAADYQYVFGDGVEGEIDRHMAQAAKQGGLFNANGRGVRTLFEQTIARQARRVVRNRLHQKEEIVRIHMEDLPWDTGRSRLQIVKEER